jgi:FkbM family methyltransferase
MNLKTFIKSIIKVTGYELVNSNYLSTLREIRYSYIDTEFLLKNQVVNTIFDVGAYWGFIGIKYLKIFPNAKIYCFEPYPNSYQGLIKNSKEHPNLIPYNYGVSDVNSKIKFYANKFDQTNSILQPDRSYSFVDDLTNTVEQIEIESVTLDTFCNINNITEIDILKIDVQGAELKVLEGASQLLRTQKIKLIQLEVNIGRFYKNQSSFDNIIALLQRNGYFLYNMYNFNYLEKNQLGWFDAIFIH